jgi:hypothetical protein
VNTVPEHLVFFVTYKLEEEAITIR